MSNLFKDFVSKLNLSNGGSSDSAVGVDIGSSSIKIVEIKKKGGKAVLETYGLISLGPYGEVDSGKVTNLPAEKLTEALKEGLKQSDVNTGSIALSMPVQSSLVFTLELPANIKQSSFSSVIPTEARKYIPVPINEVTIDWFLLPHKQESFAEANSSDVQTRPMNKTEVLVVAIQNDAITKYKSIISQANLKAGFFEIEVFSSVRANLEHELSLVLLMDFGASRTKLTFVEFGIVKSFHLIGRGGAEISESISKSLDLPFSEAEKMKKEFGLFGNPNEKEMAGIIRTHLDYIFSETNNILLAYERRYNRTVSKVILTGGGSLIKGLKEIAVNNFKSEVELGNPFSKVGSPEFLEKVLSSTGPEFATALGLALRKLQ